MRRSAGALAAALLAVLIVTAPAGAQAQYPTKPIRLVVPFAPGGSSSIIARAFSTEMSKGLGQQFVIENKPGGGGNIAMEDVAKADPDGYTLIIGHIGTFAVNPFMFAKLPFDTNRDFRAVSLFSKVPQIYVVPSGVPAKDLREFIALAKKEPGKLNYGSAGNGSAGHLAGEMFKAQAGVFMVHIPYAGGNPAQLALLSGQVDLNFDNLAAASANIKAGKLRALAVTTAKRSSA
ncbi:MAG TPA: tripartite tricarboxylate transporter substrate-binding protein, partial [Burkholderiales bacterium]|nr:tripartite tricarboxylate transporter substrate-binding protein [Burkholderiales bacterium]